jgi:hypothetical protein
VLQIKGDSPSIPAKPKQLSAHRSTAGTCDQWAELPSQLPFTWALHLDYVRSCISEQKRGERSSHQLCEVENAKAAEWAGPRCVEIHRVVAIA